MAKTRKRPLTAWNLFVQKVKKENPSKSFKEVLLMASSLKKKGQMNMTNGNKESGKMVKAKRVTGKKRR
uniref:HMG box domain-containing protein n=1 Tax=viral metagenome TaxID=1070528 RepID=A0A6C0JIV0_9ZZZZ